MTDREKELHKALKAGDADEVEKSRNRAKDQEAWQEDYDNAWRAYQEENELDEKEREKLTAERVKQENHEAMEGL